MLTIPSEALSKLKAEALEAFPYECCGFLFGFVDEYDHKNLHEVLPVLNNKEGDKRRRFEISAFDYMKAEQYAEDTGTMLIGIYHSHPMHPSIPSEHDRIAALPFFSYVILSVESNRILSVQSWLLNDQQQFLEEIIHYSK